MSKGIENASPFVAAAGVDAIVRKLAYLPGMTPQDKQALQAIRVQLGGIRLRHMPVLDVAGLPDDLAKCLNGPCVDGPRCTARGARGRA
ncbi:MAG: hypothetical protein HY916_09295 [Desulfovibrio sp.]|jgi:hypothetical protein|nr:hypothetical protein [Desulfovibrio sp.]